MFPTPSIAIRTTSPVFAVFGFNGSGDHRDLHNAQHSFPTRRSSDLPVRGPRRISSGDLHDGASQHARDDIRRSEEHTSELQSLCVISYAVFCLKKKKKKRNNMYSAIKIKLKK